MTALNHVKDNSYSEVILGATLSEYLTVNFITDRRSVILAHLYVHTRIYVICYGASKNDSGKFTDFDSQNHVHWRKALFFK